MRVGVIRDWDAKWYADKNFAEYLHEDLAIRKFLYKKLKEASVSNIQIERAANRVIVSVHTAKPGIVIGKGGSEKHDGGGCGQFPVYSFDPEPEDPRLLQYAVADYLVPFVHP